MKVLSNNSFVPEMSEIINPLAYLTDSYKISHKKFEIDGVKEIYSNFTPRFDKYMKEAVGDAWDGEYVVFGVQYALLELMDKFEKGFFNRDKEIVIQEMKDLFVPYIGWDNYEHFEALHDLGYLPVQIKALPEGTKAPIGTPFFTIRNTLKEFEWLPNYLESILSTLIWKPLTVATMSTYFKKTSDKYAMLTKGNLDGVEWQNHDFHVRGASGYESAGICGCAFLLSSCGTDNLPALYTAKKYYGSTNEQGLLAGSVSASEHSVTTLGILTQQRKLNCSLVDAEEAYVRYCLKQFPTGIFSEVCDSFDYFSLLTEILPKVKDEIMSRDGKFVVRGDSGNPVHIIAGYNIIDISTHSTVDRNNHILKLYDEGYEVFYFNNMYWKVTKPRDGNWGLMQLSEVEAIGTIRHLYKIFGGTVNEQGYIELDSHIGMIYGDGINLKRQEEILKRLYNNGYASTNVVFGVGSYSLNLLGRDHLGMAIKATNAIVEIDGVEFDEPIYKDPKTDTSKKSARGLLYVGKGEDGKIVWFDRMSRESESEGLLRTIFKDGEINHLENIFQIRERLWNN